MVRDRRRGPASRPAASSALGLHGPGRRIRARADPARQPDAFAELGFAPHVVGLPAERALATTLMGQELAMPVMISPTGVQAVHPDAEVAVARAAAARGIPMGLSGFATKPIEEVVTAGAPTFFQTYWVGSREEILARINRARDAGAAGLIVTLDWSFSHGRDWGSPFIPSARQPGGGTQLGARPRAAPGLALELRQDRAPARARHAEHGAPGPTRPEVLRGLRPVDADAAAHLGRRRLAGEVWNGPLDAQGDHPRR